MKKHYVMGLIPGEEITEFFIVKRAEVKTGANGKQYFDILLGDKTGDISGKKWDVDANDEETLSRFKPGDIIKIRGQITEWNGSPQIRIGKIRKSSTSDIYDMTDYLKAAPEHPDAMYAYIHERAEKIKDDDFRAVAVTLLDRNKDKLLYYPAAKSNHHAIYAGLLYHVKRMLMLAERICEVYSSLDSDLLATGVIIHDIDKLAEMEADENGMVSEYTFEGQMLGHLILGVRTIDRLAAELGLPNEKAVLLEHMMISHHYEAEYGSPKKPLFPEAEALHYLDMVDSKLYDFEDALTPVVPGGFSDWVRTLDGRRIYKASTDVKNYSKK